MKEVEEELRSFHPSGFFDPIFVDTMGDKDKKTSLRGLEKTDFFTRELDELLLSGNVRIAIHSAKDLPDPLPKGLAIAALTRGVDPRDSLVMGKMRDNPRIGTSSHRREEAVRELYPNAAFFDLRGTIHERLEWLDRGEADGIVVAEAALIRLQLTHLRRVYLPGPTAPLQGKLAVLAREGDEEMFELLKGIDEASFVSRS